MARKKVRHHKKLNTSVIVYVPQTEFSYAPDLIMYAVVAAEMHSKSRGLKLCGFWLYRSSGQSTKRGLMYSSVRQDSKPLIVTDVCPNYTRKQN